MFIYFLYRLLGVFAFPLILLYLLRRGLHDRRYWRDLPERFGSAPMSLDATVPGGIWLHAVSVGEVISAIELVRQLRLDFPAQRLYLSVTTVAGRQIAEEKLAHLTDGIFYPPLDLCWAVRRVLRRLKPQLIIIMETEIWPNLYREAKRFGCGLVVVNGRISDRAFQRYRRFHWFFREVLRLPGAILAQNALAAERFQSLGATAVRIAGNLKYDFRAAGLEPPPAVRDFLQRLQPSKIWIAASTMPPAAEGDPDEDDAVIAAFQELTGSYPRLLLMLVPRRPERFSEAERKLNAAGIPYVRRSALPAATALPLPSVLLLDTMGELTSLFSAADVVFMGGTLAQRGGHNILEPAFFSKPVIIGPHMENFPEIAAEFRSSGAVYEIAAAAGLAHAVHSLLADPALGARIGMRARELADAKGGATGLAVYAAREAYTDALPRRVRPFLWIIVLWPFSLLWRAGTALDRRIKLMQQGRLKAPVISIGGIAMGGTGKTPLTSMLAARLKERGLSPAILTRGYRRISHEKNTVLGPGETCSVTRTGDEAQILLRLGTAAIGIGADRLATGRLLEERFHPRIILLDDGFQHWRLHRQVELVLLDALNPFAGNAIFPLGRLREPLSALGRASAFVITRASIPTPWRALEERLREINPATPIFYSRVVPVEWVEWNGNGRTYAATELPPEPKAVFCGIGNPASFYSTLHQLRIQTVYRWAFDDHEAYRPRQLQRLAIQAASAGASILLATEKDIMNLPGDAALHLGPLRLFWLKARLEMDREDTFLEWLFSQIGKTTN